MRRLPTIGGGANGMMHLAFVCAEGLGGKMAGYSDMFIYT